MIGPTTLEQQARAMRLYRTALYDGLLVPADRCERCGKTAEGRKLDGHHHHGYADEHALDVVWLCQQCHRLAHSATPRDTTLVPSRVFSRRVTELIIIELTARIEIQRITDSASKSAAKRRRLLHALHAKLGTWKKVADATGQKLPTVHKAASQPRKKKP